MEDAGFLIDMCVIVSGIADLRSGKILNWCPISSDVKFSGKCFVIVIQIKSSELTVDKYL